MREKRHVILFNAPEKSMVQGSVPRAQCSVLKTRGSGLRAQDTGSRAVEESLHLCNGMHNTPYRITKFRPIDHARPCWVQRRKQLLFFLLVQPAGENTVADGVERADWHNL